VLLTEYGYGSLGNPACDTVEGRVRQWRWFKTVGEQIRKQRIAGPMAFYLPPYFENNTLEFGLSVHAKPGAIAGLDHRSTPHPNLAGTGRPARQFTSGGLTYGAADFGLRKPQSWMGVIGREYGNNAASPALAWLQAYGWRHAYPPKNWRVAALAPSSVVIDFVAGDGLVQAKRYGGYLALRRDPGFGPIRAGSGSIVLYNFSDQPVTGRLVVTQGGELLAATPGLTVEHRLAPMDRVVLPVTVEVPAAAFTGHGLAVRFVTKQETASAVGRIAAGDNAPGGTISLFSTRFYPEATGMKETVLYDFARAASTRQTGSGRTGSGEATLPEGSAGNRRLLGTRPLATEEPRLAADAGHWRATRGVDVTEAADGTWRFAVREFPAEPSKPAMAELPLPDDFSFPDDGMLMMQYRLVDPPATTKENGRYFELYFRMANGNLYQVWPRQYAMAAWQSYTEVKRNFTMAFYGRAKLPWRFEDNRPVALVFFFRPGQVPATYEVKQARISRWSKAQR
jgi:hypothetical protein